MLRETDYIGMTESGELQILLSNVHSEDALHVVDRLARMSVHAEVHASSDRIREAKL
ncbi:hypothetical protein D3C77_801720 [compost metagenome]